ncbi:MAG: hypothetical protein KIS96_08785 [Bauldia sp.]|nr:hypothetical protein [Bauldia sp.]
MADLPHLDENWLEEALAELEKQAQARKLRHDNPWARDLIRVLWPYPKGLRRQYVLDRVWSLRNPVGLPIPRRFDQAVQAAFNAYNVESEVFKKSGRGQEDGLFYPFGGKGSGVWAVNHERAEAWLRRKALGDA